MKLRLDLLEHNHRYKPEPLLSKTGVGSLASASPEERAQEEARSIELIRKLEERASQTRNPALLEL